MDRRLWFLIDTEDIEDSVRMFALLFLDMTCSLARVYLTRGLPQDLISLRAI